MNWEVEVIRRKEDLIRDTQEFLRINSVMDETTAGPGKPFGEGVNASLTSLLELGEKEGFTTKNLDGFAGHIEWGEGDDIVGVLCHVDVVPPGDDWTSDPFSAEIRNGRIYARGAIDDKGPTMAAFYALKIVKDMNLPLSKRVRMIIGTDEESDWRCVEHYFKHEEMPTLGFAPDADFPIINAEKGIIDASLLIPHVANQAEPKAVLVSFQSGLRLNMVPDAAEAVIEGQKKEEILSSFKDMLRTTDQKGEAEIENGQLILRMYGLSCHAMEPNNGINAGILLCEFLQQTELDDAGLRFVQVVTDKFSGDTRGKKLNIDCEDEISGELTLNVGTLCYKEGQGGELGINIRYPVTAESKAIRDVFESATEFELGEFKDSKPHHVSADHPLVKTLQKVYEGQLGKKADLISIGGGTYARSLKAGVAFGPLFPGRPDSAHQKDEYIEIDDLLRSTALYAQAIYELAK
ncbi:MULTISPECIES: dipeptidase PepV [unclassified Bacillus (in: firmicutes)]|uniref:dipeptidase PepV n=1 Tax=unclassified Bacillus (in: firmicutes) TaxID=185979 RepID=UPI0002597517|nr:MULTISPECIES: dipeptidase PepV [unclassified Bacillus (in: firmicutes)]AFI29534.1 dipeptidase [Bacillus sp. JS]GFM14767.1 dipeptidase PepV [Bacillus sp. FW1]